MTFSSAKGTKMTSKRFTSGDFSVGLGLTSGYIRIRVGNFTKNWNVGVSQMGWIPPPSQVMHFFNGECEECDDTPPDFK